MRLESSVKLIVAVRTPTAEQARVAMQRIDPFLGRYSSAWCRQVLYSTLHHTSGTFDQQALTNPKLTDWFNAEPWPRKYQSDIYNTDQVHWCKECLQCGYHCFGHQLVGLARCPLHGTPMRCGCPKCEFALPMRSRFTPECGEPLRNCVHCHEPILSVAESFKWPKNPKFILLEREALRRYAFWAQRVERLRYRFYLHTEGLQIVGAPRWPSKVQTRIAIEAVFPLPPGIQTDTRPPGLTVTVVVLDARSVREPLIPARIRSALGKVMLRHLGRLPLPSAWQRHWRTGALEAPTPANSGESSHFEIWREQMFASDRAFKPTAPVESLRPCMLPLLATRIVSQLNDMARWASCLGVQDLAASFYFADDQMILANAPLGDLPGIIVELHHGCDGALFRPSSEFEAAEA